MEKLQPLNYARPIKKPRISRLAVASFVFGMLGGPIAICAAMIVDHFVDVSDPRGTVALYTFGFFIIAPIAFGVFTIVRLATEKHTMRGIEITVSGCIAAIAWPGIILLVMVFVLN